MRMTAVPVLDDQTAIAIRDAMTAARSGRMPEAVGIGERALANGGNPGALNAMLGTLQCQLGNLDAGIRHLRVAQTEAPGDPVIASNLATALAQQGSYGAALDLLTEDVAAKDPTFRLQRMRAFFAQEAGDHGIAIPAYEKIVSAEPRDWEAWNNLGNSRRLAGDPDGSVAALERAAELNPSSPPVRLNYAMALAGAGRVDEAEQRLRGMAADYPQDTKPLQELYAIFKELGREDEALDAIAEASARNPADLGLAILVAGQELNVLRPEDAEVTYRRILAADPAHELATIGLAVVFELANRTDELFDLIEKSQGTGVGENVINFIGAMGYRRSKKFAEGLELLKKVPEDLESTRRFHLLGQLEEGAGHYEEAFAAFTQMNDLQARDLTKPLERAAAYRERLVQQRATLSQAWLKEWRVSDVSDGRASPAFIVGFPRSGTTLLDTMLMGHPQIEVLEEEPALLEAAKILERFDDIQKLGDEKIREARDLYFKVAAERTPLASGKVLVDKNPLTMNSLPLVRRLFPDAKIILALRHPCDAVFSCFASNFKLNDGMSSFLHLDTAADLYDVSFSYFEKARELFALPVHEIKYENIVEDRERELKALIAFLGLDWSEQVLDHESTALSRGRIKTPSYHQVVQPIYSQSAGRWTNYRKHLEPILPALEPWIAKFGYND